MAYLVDLHIARLEYNDLAVIVKAFLPNYESL